MKHVLKYLVAAAIALVIIAVLAYLFVPPFNLTAPSFWIFTCVSFIIMAISLGIAGSFDYCQIPAFVSGAGALLCLLILLIGLLAGSSAFHANENFARLNVENTTFESVFDDVNWSSVPQLDQNSAHVLALRKMGELVEDVSQYDVTSPTMYKCPLINISGKPVRIEPLKYADILKYFANNDRGVIGYIPVDCVEKSAEFIRLEEGMQYVPSASFSKDLGRYLRTKFPSLLFDNFSFEVDDNGNPYYVIPTYKYSAGIGGVKTPTGCILLDPVTGTTEVYAPEDIPAWIDHAIDDDLVVDMIDSWGTLEGGWFNSWTSQKNVKTSTSGFNFVTIGNDVYLYTGITSVVLDESNIGFMLVNMRTGAAKYFEMPSSEEYSAMDAAVNEYRHLNYTSTFPILINLQGNPTYFLSLKDASGIVKMQALVSVEDIQVRTVVDASMGIDTLVKEHCNKFVSENTEPRPEDVVQYESTTFTIINIYSVIVGGNTQYYFEDGNGNIYMTDITKSIKLPVFKIGDEITITYSTTDTDGYFNIATIQ